MTHVSLVAPFRSGLLLLGKRRSGPYTLIGGHAEGDESPLETAKREMKEESGLTGKNFKLIDTRTNAQGLKIYTFKCEVGEDVPDSSKDPDQEIKVFSYHDISAGIPKAIAENLTGPKDPDENVATDVFGLGKSESLTKHDTPEFQSWFQGSKVTDPQGLPLKVYHGTSKDQNFSKFKIGQRGAWFTADPAEASNYAGDNDSQEDAKLDIQTGQYRKINTAPRVIPAYLSLKNPYKMTPKDLDEHMHVKNYRQYQAQLHNRLKAAGHDSVDYGNGTYVAFHPHQIKSVFNERPTAYPDIGKSEDLDKMALSDVRIGKRLGTSNIFNYNHLLPPGQFENGYDLEIYKQPSKTIDGYFATLKHLGREVGHINAYSDNTRTAIEPHSDLKQEHHGKGLGSAMYEALFAHAKHNGIQKVNGDLHSGDASKVHQRLAAKHGLDYVPKSHDPQDFQGRGSFKPYEYALKSEIPLEKMAIADIPKGKSDNDPDFPTFDYNHILTPEHRAAGYTLSVEGNQGRNGDMIAMLEHPSMPNQLVGRVRGEVRRDALGRPSITPHSTLHVQHRGKGLGQAMYEAVFAHAYHNGIQKVKGQEHTEDAHKVHRALAAKHGMGYDPTWYPEDEAGEGEAAEGRQTPYDAGPYQYTLKSEPDLAKMAIKDIPKGKFDPKGVSISGMPMGGYDYSHLLKPEHLAEGYNLVVRHQPKDQLLESHLLQNGHRVGHVSGLIEQDPGEAPFIEPHADLNAAHRGKGFGTAMYEAVYAHAYHKGIRQVRGQHHSPDAQRVHVKLAQKHGLKYNAKPAAPAGVPRELGGDFGGRGSYGPYQYALKSEGADEGEILAKFQKITGFPKLGIEDRRETPFIDTPGQARHKKEQLASVIHPDLEVPPGSVEQPGEKREFARQHAADIMRRAYGAVMVSPDKSHASPSFVYSENARRGMGMGRGSKTSDLSTKLHEDFHQMMARVHQQYGFNARTQLAQNLWNSIPSKIRKVVDFFTSSRNKGVVGSPHENEEHLAILHNFLNDPQERERFNDANAIGPETARVIHTAAKVAMKHLNRVAPAVDERWLMGPVKHGEPAAAQAPKVVKLPKVTKPAKTKAPPAQANPDQLQLFKCQIAPWDEAPSVEDIENFLKAEPDEVSRGLAHPSPIERRMALKLSGVAPKHLIRALGNDDSEVRNQALAHPAFNSDVLMALARMPERHAEALKLIKHPMLTADHLDALYDTHKDALPEIKGPIVKELSHHDLLGPDLIHKMVADGNGAEAIDSLHAPADILAHVVQDHMLNQDDPDKQILARRALRHPNLDPALANLAFKSGPPDVKLAVVHGPHLGEAEALDTLKRGQFPQFDKEAMLRTAIVSRPQVTQKQLEEASRDRVRAVAQAARFKLDPTFVAKADAWLVDNLAKAEPQEMLGSKQRQNLVAGMLGHRPGLESALSAASFLAGRQADPQSIRQALLQHDDPEEAALFAHGLEVNEGNVRAMRGVKIPQASEKAELPEITQVFTGHPDAKQTAEAIQRAVVDKFLLPVNLGGKHSQGSFLARDPETNVTWLLKPGSGGISPAAGVAEDPSSQSRREAAFYHMADTWGLGDYLPRADLVITDKGKEYAAIQLLPWDYQTMDRVEEKDPGFTRKTLLPYLNTGALYQWAILDAVLGQTDRHLNNLMANDGDVKLIDHGSSMAGKDFDPAFDTNSFIPAYLRMWGPKNFRKLSPEDKLKYTPRLGREAEERLRAWLNSLESEQLNVVLLRYGVDPGPAQQRLAKIKAMAAAMPVDLAVAKFWYTV